jgi:hypothetical protein
MLAGGLAFAGAAVLYDSPPAGFPAAAPVRKSPRLRTRHVSRAAACCWTGASGQTARDGLLTLAAIFVLGLQALTRARAASPPLRRARSPGARRASCGASRPAARLAGALPGLVMVGSAAYATLPSAGSPSSATTCGSFDLGSEGPHLERAPRSRPFFKSSPLGGERVSLARIDVHLLSAGAHLRDRAQRGRDVADHSALMIGGA